MTHVRIRERVDFAELGQQWRALEARSACSFFRSWTWVGCLAAERFPDPLVVEATESGRIVALGLFNRTRSGLWLGASGTASLDSPYVEQNGILAEAGREVALTAACLGAICRRCILLPGVGDETLTAVRRAADLVVIRRTQASPFVDLAALRRDGRDYLPGRSANTRAQIRRSDRWYAHRSESDAAIGVTPAATLPEAMAMLEDMATLHQDAWIRRGRPGSFADPFFRRFHHALIETGFARGEIALLRVSCDGIVIGILYNFAYRGRMLAYQNGFAYQAALGPAKPGLTCHHAAISYALATGFDVYDFLAGDGRYKRSLADAQYQQSWVESGPFYAPRLLMPWFLQRRPVRRATDALSAYFTHPPSGPRAHAVMD